MKKLINFLKPFVFAPFILYIFNLMAVGINIYIPINIVTIFIVGALSIPGLVLLIVFYLFIF